MNDIELETLKNYARIIKAFCNNCNSCSDCPFGENDGKDCTICTNEDEIPCDWGI